MKKKVNVLLSIYKPDINYLKQQLESIDEQTYKNIEILIHDDCVEERTNTEIIKRFLKKKEFRILPYKDKNLGYTKAFEYLVKESDGDIVAFCDQDDIWDTTKIEECIECLEKEKTVLVTTDRRLIDENGKIFCESVRHTSNKIYEKWNTGDHILNYNFFTTCAVGMCIVADGAFARKCIPFSTNTGHDKWLVACACVSGGVSYLDKVLVSYRRHGKNVSGVMTEISTKKDYEEKRVIPHLKLIKEFRRKYPECGEVYPAYEFAMARKDHNIYKLIKYRKYAPDIAKFEIVLACIPSAFVPWLVKGVKIITGK